MLPVAIRFHQEIIIICSLFSQILFARCRKTRRYTLIREMFTFIQSIHLLKAHPSSLFFHYHSKHTLCDIFFPSSHNMEIPSHSFLLDLRIHLNDLRVLFNLCIFFSVQSCKDYDNELSIFISAKYIFLSYVVNFLFSPCLIRHHRPWPVELPF